MLISKQKPKIFATLSAFVLTSASMSTLLGISVLLGWYSHNIKLIQVHPSFVPMQYNTAIGFLLCGIALLVHHYNIYKRIVLFLSLVISTLGLLTLIQYSFNIDLHIDQFFIDHYITVETSHPGRMAPNTALCFFISGLAIFLASLRAFRFRRRIIAFLGMIVIALGFVALAGYFTKIESVYGWGNLTRMAVHTLIGFVIVGLSIVFTMWRNVFVKNNILIPRWGSYPILIGGFTIAIAMWQALVIQANTEESVLSVIFLIVSVIGTIIAGVAVHFGIRLHFQTEQIVYEQQRSKNIDENFNAISNAASDVFITIDRNNTILFANASVLNLFGYTPGELIGNPLLTIIPEKLKNHHSESFKKYAFSGVKTINWKGVELKGLHKNGNIFPIEVSFGEYFKDSEKRFIGIIRNISRRKKIEKEVLRLSAAVHQSPVSILITDETGSIEYINPKLLEVTGYLLDDLIGVNTRIFKSGKQSPDIYIDLWKTITSGEVWEGEFQNKKKNGDLFWEYATIAAIKDENDDITNFVALKEDITNRKQMESQIQLTQKLETIGSLAGGIAHDFNNLLTPMINNLELAFQNMTPDHPAYYYLNQIKTSTNLASQITKQILSFGRQEQVDFQPLLLNTIINETIGLIKPSLSKSILIEKSINIHDGYVWANSGQMHQVIMNLFTNALHAMKEKGGTLSISLDLVQIDEQTQSLPNLGNGEHILMTISDTGTGIDSDKIHRIFEPFYTSKESLEGTGLGLSVIHGIINTCNGEITVESKPNVGTIFKVYIPQMEYKPTSTVMPPEQMAILIDPQINILFVDDDKDIVQGFKQAFKSRGYIITGCYDVISAIEIFSKSSDNFDLVITDHSIGDMTGDVLAKTIWKTNADIPIILLTGYTDRFTYDEMIDIGFAEIVSKPITSENFAKIIRKVLNTD